MSDRKALGEQSEKVGGGMTEVSIDLGAEPQGPPAGPKEVWHDAFVGEPAKIIEDPKDGMPRPDDTGPLPQAPAPLSPETLVCLEDESEWVEVWREEASDLEGKPRMRPKSFLRRQFGPDGVEHQRRVYPAGTKLEKRWGNSVVIDGGETVFVRAKRERCQYLCAFISPVSDVDVQGKPAEPIFLFCDKFRTVGGAKMSLFDETVTACTERFPYDATSVDKIKVRLDAKIAAGKNRTTLPIFKRVDEGVSVEDWRAKAATFSAGRVVVWTPAQAIQAAGMPSTVASSLAIVTPASAGDDRSRPVSLVVLVDEAWQPPAEVYEGTGYGNVERWGVDGRDERILRLNLDEPTFDDEADAATWPAYRQSLLPIALMRNAAACAHALARGKNVDIVATSTTAQAAFFAALVHAHLLRCKGLDALERLQASMGCEVATSLAFRVFLRGVDLTT